MPGIPNPEFDPFADEPELPEGAKWVYGVTANMMWDNSGTLQTHETTDIREAITKYSMYTDGKSGIGVRNQKFLDTLDIKRRIVISSEWESFKDKI